MKSMTQSSKIFAVNRRARFDYEISETIEAGIILLGTEIKAMREGRVNLKSPVVRTCTGKPENAPSGWQRHGTSCD